MAVHPRAAIGVAALVLLVGCSCRGGRGRSDGALEKVHADDEVVGDLALVDSTLPAIVLDPDDEAFGTVEDLAGQDGRDAGAGEDYADGVKGPVLTVKGTVESADPESGLLVINQLLADGRRHDVKFWADDQTHVGWSKASMKMSLADLPEGITVHVTYHVVGKGLDRRNRAMKVIIPGGMQDVAKMILGDPEGVAGNAEKSQKSTKKH